MHAPRSGWMAALTLALLVGSPQQAPAQSADVVYEWNRIMVTLAVPGNLPSNVFFTYPGAMTSAAVFDAVNSFDYLYTPFAVRVGVPSGASRDAAVAQAAHDVLVAFFPSQRAMLDAALASTLGGITPAAAQGGARVGAETAREILELRRFDGWGRVPPPYVLPDEPGNWQPTPPANAPAGVTHYPDVEPFVAGGRTWIVEPPPALTSERYAADLNEVKALGGATSTARTEDQTLMARLFASVGTPTGVLNVWNSAARGVAQSRGISGLEVARVFALLNMTLHDAVRISMTSKYIYGLWRPVTAIRGADRDGNPATTSDPTWSALIPTPPYPSYPGNMACVGGSGSRVLALLFGGDSARFSVTWTQVDGPGWTRFYNGFRQLGDEAARSRIYGGIHYQFDTLASMGVCTELADYAASNNLRPRFP